MKYIRIYQIYFKNKNLPPFSEGDFFDSNYTINYPIHNYTNNFSACLYIEVKFEIKAEGGTDVGDPVTHSR